MVTGNGGERGRLREGLYVKDAYGLFWPENPTTVFCAPTFEIAMWCSMPEAFTNPGAWNRPSPGHFVGGEPS